MHVLQYRDVGIKVSSLKEKNVPLNLIYFIVKFISINTTDGQHLSTPKIDIMKPYAS